MSGIENAGASSASGDVDLSALGNEIGVDLSDAHLAQDQLTVPDTPPPPETPATPVTTATPAPTPAPPPATPTHPAPSENQFAGVLRDLITERDRNRALEQRLAQIEQRTAQPKPPVELPDPFMDPVGHTRGVVDPVLEAALNPVRQQLQQALVAASIAEARSTYGVETTKKAADAFDEAEATLSPIERASVRQARNPYVAAVEWMQRRDMQKEVGNDLAAYRQRLLDEALKDPQYLGRAVEAARAVAAANPGQVSAQSQTQPRNQAGQFTAKAAALPSLAQSGSNQGGAPSAKEPDLSDEELIEIASKAKKNPWA